MRSGALISLIIVLSLLLTACPSIWNSTALEENAKPEELYKRANALFDKGYYDEATGIYERIKSAHPDFEEMPLVYLKIAESFYRKGDYEQAIARYNQFLELNPQHPSTDRAKYMRAMCYFKMMKPIDRDDRMIHLAVKAFKEVMDDTQAPEWRKKAEAKYNECRKKLAEKQLYIARTYISTKNYNSAKSAAQRVLDNYSGLGLDDEAKRIIKRAGGS